MNRHRFAEQLFVQHQSLWQRIVFPYVGNAADAQDIVQESYRKFLSVERDWASFEDAKRYFSTILVHTAVDFYKIARKKHEGLTPEAEATLPERAAFFPWRRSLDATQQEREEAVLARALELLSGLPEEQKVPIVRLILAEKPCTLRELGQELQLPLSTLKSRALLGIEKIKKSLRKNQLL